LLCILRIVAPNERVGLTTGATLCFAMIKSSFYLSSGLYQGHLMVALLGHEPGHKRIVKVNSRASGVFFGSQVLLSWVPFFSINNQDKAQEIFLFHTATTCMSLIFVAVQAIYVKNRVVEVFDNSYKMTKQKRILLAKERTVANQMQAFKQGAIYGFVFLVIFIWPFMWTKHDYYLPISWITYPLVAYRVARTSLSQADNDNTSRFEVDPKHPSFDSETSVSTRGAHNSGSSNKKKKQKGTGRKKSKNRSRVSSADIITMDGDDVESRGSNLSYLTYAPGFLSSKPESISEESPAAAADAAADKHRSVDA